MQLNTGQWAVVIIAGILILGFILGYYNNRQRAEKIFHWVKQGLSTLGEVSLGDKLPGMTTGGRLEVNQAAAPFKRLEAVYLLAPRENPLFLIFHLLQRRGDELIVWGTYQSKPQQSVEVARRGDRQYSKRMQDKDKPALSPLEGVGPLQVAIESVPGSLQEDRLRAFLAKFSSQLIRLAIRPEKPNLYLRVSLRVMKQVAPEELFATLKDLGG